MGSSLNIVLTGSAVDANGEKWLRKQLVEMALKNSLYVVSNVTPMTKFLVASEKAVEANTKKYADAAKHGIPVIDYAEFIHNVLGIEKKYFGAKSKKPYWDFSVAGQKDKPPKKYDGTLKAADPWPEIGSDLPTMQEFHTMVGKLNLSPKSKGTIISLAQSGKPGYFGKLVYLVLGAGKYGNYDEMIDFVDKEQKEVAHEKAKVQFPSPANPVDEAEVHYADTTTDTTIHNIECHLSAMKMGADWKEAVLKVATTTDKLGELVNLVVAAAHGTVENLAVLMQWVQLEGGDLPLKSFPISEDLFDTVLVEVIGNIAVSTGEREMIKAIYDAIPMSNSDKKKMAKLIYDASGSDDAMSDLMDFVEDYLSDHEKIVGITDAADEPAGEGVPPLKHIMAKGKINSLAVAPFDKELIHGMWEHLDVTSIGFHQISKLLAEATNEDVHTLMALTEFTKASLNNVNEKTKAKIHMAAHKKQEKANKLVVVNLDKPGAWDKIDTLDLNDDVKNEVKAAWDAWPMDKKEFDHLVQHIKAADNNNPASLVALGAYVMGMMGPVEMTEGSVFIKGPVFEKLKDLDYTIIEKKLIDAAYHSCSISEEAEKLLTLIGEVNGDEVIQRALLLLFSDPAEKLMVDIWLSNLHEPGSMAVAAFKKAQYAALHGKTFKAKDFLTLAKGGTVGTDTGKAFKDLSEAAKGAAEVMNKFAKAGMEATKATENIIKEAAKKKKKGFKYLPLLGINEGPEL